jgi:hypothetical protein
MIISIPDADFNKRIVSKKISMSEDSVPAPMDEP